MNSASRVYNIFSSFLQQDSSLLTAWKNVFNVRDIFEVYHALSLTYKEVNKIEKFFISTGVIGEYKKNIDVLYSILSRENLRESAKSHHTIVKENIEVIGVFKHAMPNQELDIEEHLQNINAMIDELLNSFDDIEDNYYAKFALLKLQESIKMYKIYGVEEFVQYAKIFQCLDADKKLSSYLTNILSIIANAKITIGFRAEE